MEGEDGSRKLRLDTLTSVPSRGNTLHPRPDRDKWWANRLSKSPRAKEKTLVLHLDDMDAMTSTVTTTDGETEWSEWDDPAWVKDENVKKVSNRRKMSWSGLTPRITMPQPAATETITATKKKKRSKSLKIRRKKEKGRLPRMAQTEAVRKKGDAGLKETPITIASSEKLSKEKVKRRKPQATFAKASPNIRHAGNENRNPRMSIQRRASSGDAVRSSSWEQDEATEPELRKNSVSQKRHRSASMEGSTSSDRPRGRRLKDNWHLRHSGTFRFYKSLSGTSLPLNSVASASSDSLREGGGEGENCEKEVGDDWNDITLSLRQTSPRGILVEKDESQKNSANVEVEASADIDTKEGEKESTHRQTGGIKEESAAAETTIVKKSEVKLVKGDVTFQKTCTLTLVKKDNCKGRVQLRVEKTVHTNGMPRPERKFLKAYSWDNLDLLGNAHAEKTYPDKEDACPSPVRLVESDSVHRVKDVVKYFQMRSAESMDRTASAQEQSTRVTFSRPTDAAAVPTRAPLTVAPLYNPSLSESGPHHLNPLRKGAPLRRSRSFAVLNEERKRRESEQVLTYSGECTTKARAGGKGGKSILGFRLRRPFGGGS